MVTDVIFSWAEDVEGRMVHVDDVPRGNSCGCKCPYCHEPLVARQGDVNQHGFAHRSKERGANLKICYMVTMYKLAEQIIRTKKHVYAPSYYGIFPEKDIEFIDVEIDSRFEREDRQPDVIATTRDRQQYIVEFIFPYKVQHGTPIDYKNMNLLEIDLSNQKLETLEEFLLSSPDGRKWVNNEACFSGIESRYANAGKEVRIVKESECGQCEVGSHGKCAAIVVKDSMGVNPFLVIENGGQKYRLCKSQLFRKNQQDYEWHKIEEERWEREREKEKQEEERRKHEIEEEESLKQTYEKLQTELTVKRRFADGQEILPDTSSRTCFLCEVNLDYRNRNGYANCGAWRSLKVPEKTPPSYAQTCSRFKEKS